MKKLKVVSVVGTRPEIIRLSRVLARLDEYCDHVLVHTGQEGREGLERGLLEDFGPEVAQSVLRHVYELSEAPLGARTAPESQRGVIRGAGGLPGGPEQPERY